jgi:hypothetical protein
MSTIVSAILLSVSTFMIGPASAQPTKKILAQTPRIIATGIDQLIKLQHDDDAWPYEGVYRVNRKIPVGYRIGGTAICCTALLYGSFESSDAPSKKDSEYAIRRGVKMILVELKDPLINIAPYYFYYGHRDVAQAINRLPPEKQQAHVEKFTAILMKTRDTDGTWIDRVFDQSKSYGTAMSVLALLGDKALMPDRVSGNGT